MMAGPKATCLWPTELAPEVADGAAVPVDSVRQLRPDGGHFYRRTRARLSNRFEFHADPVEPAPPRHATATIAIHPEIELLGKTVGIDHEEQPPSGRYVSNRANDV
jgi:hypothetical protein